MIIWTEKDNFLDEEIITRVILYTDDINLLKNKIDFTFLANDNSEIYTEWLKDQRVLTNSFFKEERNLFSVRPMFESDVEEVCSWLKEHITFGQKNRITFDCIDFDCLLLYDSNVMNKMFRCATFKNCNFNNAMCRWVSFASANFINTTISNSYFVNCDFPGAEFEHCKVHGDSNFYGCDFRDTINPPHIPSACPSEGGFIGWKKALYIDKKTTGNFYCAGLFEEKEVLIKLYIPADAKRSSATGNKCRCSKAKVLDITSLDEKEHFDKAFSNFNRDFEYAVGKYIIPNRFNPDRFCECASGIHFFIDKEDAINY